jgi:hypothetical protein
MEKSLQIVSFEQAKKLKEVGFDWPCDRYYLNFCGLDDDADRYAYNWNTSDQAEIGERLFGDPFDCTEVFSAPEISLALKWLMEVKKIYAHMMLHQGFRWSGRCCQKIEKIDGEGEVTIVLSEYNEPFVSYEEAEIALLDEVLTFL